MPQSKPVNYADAGADVLAVYHDIMATRGIDDINNFWKHIVDHPLTLKRAWENVKEAMAPGAVDSLTKEMILWRRTPATAMSIVSAATPTPPASGVQLTTY